MIEINNITKKYGRFTAVDNISFNVEKGQVVGFLGPNGAGKTTTLKMLTGYLPATKGTATIGGHDIFTDSINARRKIGYMPENVPLYDDMRVTEYLKYRAQLKGLRGSAVKKQLGHVLETCGLAHMRKRMIKTLSKGYRQRVGLADALIHEPDLLILDEPTNGLDPNQIRSIRELIKRLGESYTVLISTHILSEVEMIADHVIIIDSGKVKASDTPKNLSQNMRSAGKITLEVRGADEKIITSGLQGLEHVKKVTNLTQDPTSPWLEYDILCESGTDSRERISNLISQKNWSMRTLHRHRSTLEDVFIELTRKD